MQSYSQYSPQDLKRIKRSASHHSGLKLTKQLKKQQYGSNRPNNSLSHVSSHTQLRPTSLPKSHQLHQSSQKYMNVISRNKFSSKVQDFISSKINPLNVNNSNSQKNNSVQSSGLKSQMKKQYLNELQQILRSKEPSIKTEQVLQSNNAQILIQSFDQEQICQNINTFRSSNNNKSSRYQQNSSRYDYVEENNNIIYHQLVEAPLVYRQQKKDKNEISIDPDNQIKYDTVKISSFVDFQKQKLEYSPIQNHRQTVKAKNNVMNSSNNNKTKPSQNHQQNSISHSYKSQDSQQHQNTLKQGQNNNNKRQIVSEVSQFVLRNQLQTLKQQNERSFDIQPQDKSQSSRALQKSLKEQIKPKQREQQKFIIDNNDSKHSLSSNVKMKQFHSNINKLDHNVKELSKTVQEIVSINNRNNNKKVQNYNTVKEQPDNAAVANMIESSAQYMDNLNSYQQPITKHQNNANLHSHHNEHKISESSKKIIQMKSKMIDSLQVTQPEHQHSRIRHQNTYDIANYKNTYVQNINIQEFQEQSSQQKVQESDQNKSVNEQQQINKKKETEKQIIQIQPEIDQGDNSLWYSADKSQSNLKAAYSSKFRNKTAEKSQQIHDLYKLDKQQLQQPQQQITQKSHIPRQSPQKLHHPAHRTARIVKLQSIQSQNPISPPSKKLNYEMHHLYKKRTYKKQSMVVLPTLSKDPYYIRQKVFYVSN